MIGICNPQEGRALSLMSRDTRACPCSTKYMFIFSHPGMIPGWEMILGHPRILGQGGGGGGGGGGDISGQPSTSYPCN